MVGSSVTTPSLMLSTIARTDASGVRKSWDTAAISPCRARSRSRWRANAASSPSAIVLKASANCSSSSRLVTVTRVPNSPAPIRWTAPMKARIVASKGRERKKASQIETPKEKSSSSASSARSCGEMNMR